MKNYVEAGAKYLDKHCPGWADHIELSRLRMHEPEACIVGQLQEMSEYRKALLQKCFEWELGFDISLRDEHSTYAELEQLWRAEVIKRRNWGYKYTCVSK